MVQAFVLSNISSPWKKEIVAGSVGIFRATTNHRGIGGSMEVAIIILAVFFGFCVGMLLSEFADYMTND